MIIIPMVHDMKKNNYIAFPHDMYLPESGGMNVGEKIVCCEPPDRWNLQDEAYLWGTGHD